MSRPAPVPRFSPLLAVLICSTVISAAPLCAEEATELQQIDVAGAAVDQAVNGYVAQGSQSGTKTAAPLTKTAQAISVVPARQIADQGGDLGRAGPALHAGDLHRISRVVEPA
ncbi:hypothetical protein ACTTAL_05250 [Rhodobacter capsulatus]